MKQGQVQFVETFVAGDAPKEDAPVGATSLHFEDAADFDEDGGLVLVAGVVLAYDSADLEEDILHLSEPLTFAVTVQDMVLVHPEASETVATVVDEDGSIDAIVPHSMRAFLPEGPRNYGEEEVVILDDDEYGRPTIADVPGEEPAMNAHFVSNAEELLLENERHLGEVLGENAAAITAAQGELSAAKQRLNDAFDEIETLPDNAYVDAAKQQAIDAAAIDAQEKADQAESEAVAAASSALATARQELDAAIASGDAAAIADAEAKIATAKQEAIDAAEADATAKAAEAMSKANAALTAAQSAQATADNAIRTYYAETPPWANGTTQPDDVLGDMWYQDSTGQAYRWNGTSWKVIQDASIGEALAAAADAQSTADGKITAFYQPNEPLEGDEGDLWFDTDDSNKVHRRLGSSWVSIADERIAAQAGQLTDLQQEVTGLEGTLDGKSVVWVQATAPSGMGASDKGDIWVNDGASPRVTKVWTGSAWVEADSRTAEVVADVERKITTYYGPEPSGSDFTTGDLWVDADGKLSRWSGSGWVELVDPKALADAVEDRALSRGTDLVTNGTGYLKTNYNFSMFELNLSDTPSGVTASFRATGGIRSVDETIPFDPSKSYRFSFYSRQVTPGSQGRMYAYLLPYDVDGYPVQPVNYMYIAGTTTTLAQDLNPGDTQMHVTDSANWYGSEDKPAAGGSSEGAVRQATFWDYVDGSGKAWGVGVYSRNGTGNDSWADGAVVGNTITLRQPWDGPAKPAGTPVSNGTSGGNYIYMSPTAANTVVPEEWTQYAQTFDSGVMDAEAHATSRTGGATWDSGVPPATSAVGIGWLVNRNASDSLHSFAGVSFSDASAAQVAAEEAQASVAAVTERTDGLAKTLWSTALPGTTTAPQDSVWYQVDGDGKIIAVFTQTAAGSAGNTWSARPIRSEAIDNLDVGKLTAAEGTINDLVANEFAAKLANIIEANIGNLTVTGDTHLENLVAQRIAGDTASFMQLTVDQILAGFLQAQWIVTETGSIIAGDPEGARVEITSDGIRVFVLGYNGVPYEAVSMVNGEVAFAVVDQTRGMLGGLSSTGNVTGQQASFADRVTVQGTDLIGRVGGGAQQGWLDRLPRGLHKINTANVNSTYGTTERAYVRVAAWLEPGRTYKAVGTLNGVTDSLNGIFRGNVRYIFGSAPAGTSSTELFGPASSPPSHYGGVASHTVTITGYLPPVSVPTRVNMILTYRAINGTQVQARNGILSIEDMGPQVIEEGGEDETPKTTYTTAWRATASRGYDKSGASIPSKEGKIDLWYFGTGTAESAGVLFGGTAHTWDEASEEGRTIPQAVSGATIHRVQLQLTNAMWWNSNATNTAINTLSSSTLPTSKVIEGFTLVKDMPEGSTLRIDLDPAWFTNGTNLGITIGDKDGTLAGELMGAGKFQGPSDPDAPQLIITYSR